MTRLDNPKIIAPETVKTGDMKEAVEGKLLRVTGKPVS